MSGAHHRHIFPARRDALPLVEAFLPEVSAGAGLPREACLRVTLPVEELFTNAVVHGQQALNLHAWPSSPSLSSSPGHSGGR